MEVKLEPVRLEVDEVLLEELLPGIDMESQEIECKLMLDRANPDSWLRTIAGFSNASGGVMLIGVEDQTHKLIGFERDKADQERNYLNNQINEHISPRPVYKIRFHSYVIHDKTRYILEADISESPIKPIIVRYHNIPAIYMRRQGYTGGATYEEIIRMSIQSQQVQYDATFSDEIYNRNQFQNLISFFEQHKENEKEELTDKSLQSFGFFDRNGRLSHGALLFRDDYQGSKTLVQCSVFGGFNRGSERLVTVNRFQGNIPAVIEFIMTFVQQRMNHGMIKLPTSRINIDAFPIRALFEGVVNAVAHRDYFLDGTQIQVDMFRDRLEISSPGGFYQGELQGKHYDLSSIMSKRRNEVICGVLVKCHVMEASGTGFDKIMEAYQQADNLHRPYINCQSDHFTLVLPDLTFEDGTQMPGDISLEYPPIENESRFDASILSFCYSQARTQAEIANHLGISNSSYLRTMILKRLTDQHFLQTEKSARTHYFRTNPDMLSLQ